MIDNKIEPKNILIYGAGAIGSLMGYLLSDAHSSDGGGVENMALLGRMGHMERISSEGLEVEAPDGKTLVYFGHLFTDLEELGRSDFHPDVVVICVKTYSLEKLCQELVQSGLLDGKLKNALFLLLMNGMGNRELFESQVPQASGRIIEGITSNGVKLAREGKIELKGKGTTVIEKNLPLELEQFMKARFEDREFQIEFSGDFTRQQWNKLFINSVINPIAALARQKKRHHLIRGAGRHSGASGQRRGGSGPRVGNGLRSRCCPRAGPFRGREDGGEQLQHAPGCPEKQDHGDRFHKRLYRPPGRGAFYRSSRERGIIRPD